MVQWQSLGKGGSFAPFQRDSVSFLKRLASDPRHATRIGKLFTAHCRSTAHSHRAIVMNLKSRIGGLLQSRSTGSEDDALDSEGLALQRRQQEAAQRAHMLRLLVTRNRELNELREIMVERRKHKPSLPQGRRERGTSPASITRPPGLADGSQLVSLINELEVKVLSEPMGLTGLPPLQPPELNAAASESADTDHCTSSKTHPLDDAALMVAARRWNPAADLLIKALGSGEALQGVDWATRSAIDLFERGGQTERADAMRRQYLQTRGRDARRIVPPPLQGAGSGRLRISRPLVWSCPDAPGLNEVASLSLLLDQTKRGTPLVLDWTALQGIHAQALRELQGFMEKAIRSQTIFVHLGLSRLIRAMRQELHEPHHGADAWLAWLSLLNWAGFRHAHQTASMAYARRFHREAPPYVGVRCVCQPLSKQSGETSEDMVCAIRFQGDLTREHAEELDRLDIRAARPGRLVMLDFRLLTSMDFFFGTDLLNWVIRRHSLGQTVAIAYAHPLMAHFVRMLGLQNYTRLHALPATAPAQ